MAVAAELPLTLGPVVVDEAELLFPTTGLSELITGLQSYLSTTSKRPLRLVLRSILRYGAVWAKKEIIRNNMTS